MESPYNHSEGESSMEGEGSGSFHGWKSLFSLVKPHMLSLLLNTTSHAVSGHPEVPNCQGDCVIQWAEWRNEV